MIFYGCLKTSKGLNPQEIPFLDWLEFEFTDWAFNMKFAPDDLKGDLEPGDGIQMPCDWEEADYDYDPETGEISFRCKGVFIGDCQYLNGTLPAFKNAVLRNAQVDDRRRPDKNNGPLEANLDGLLITDLVDLREQELEIDTTNCRIEFCAG